MSTIIEDWKKDMHRSIHFMYPSLTNDEINSTLDELVNENFIDPKSIIHNDYNDDLTLEQPLSIVYQYCNERKPILAGNGTLFYNQDQVTSPIEEVIVDRMDTRQNYKNQMKETMDKIVALGNIEDLTPQGRDKYRQLQILYEDQDRMQNEAKIRINSIYGAFGMPSFLFYNKYTAAATTGTGQSLISATGIAFEGFLGDNALFLNFGECITFMSNIIEEKYTLPVLDFKIITDYRVVYNRMANNFEYGVFDESIHGEILKDFLKQCSPSQLTKIYYKNNLFEFVKHPSMMNIITKAFSKVASFNDPNKVPEDIKEDLATLWSYCKEYVYYPHHYNERINRLKNKNRKRVKLVDTDSNLLYVQPWVDFIEENIDKSVISMSRESLDFACVNTVAYLITNMLKELLAMYCHDAHVLERYWHRINMKNEYCFVKMLFASVKKRYVGKIVLREGKAVTKIEIKGYDFKKAGVTEFVSEALTSIIKNRIMENEKPADTVGILRDLYSMEKDIETSLKNGERKYLVRMNCKGEKAYKYPYRMGQVLSVLVWNTVNPTNNIMTPDKVDVALTNITKVEDLEPIKYKFPKEYKALYDIITNSPLEVFRNKGIKYVAIPNSLDKIPEWLIPLIDYDKITTRTLGTFEPILEALELPSIKTKELNFFGNIQKNNDKIKKLRSKIANTEVSF